MSPSVLSLDIRLAHMRAAAHAAAVICNRCIPKINDDLFGASLFACAGCALHWRGHC